MSLYALSKFVVFWFLVFVFKVLFYFYFLLFFRLFVCLFVCFVFCFVLAGILILGGIFCLFCFCFVVCVLGFFSFDCLVVFCFFFFFFFSVCVAVLAFVFVFVCFGGWEWFWVVETWETMCQVYWTSKGICGIVCKFNGSYMFLIKYVFENKNRAFKKNTCNSTTPLQQKRHLIFSQAKIFSAICSSLLVRAYMCVCVCVCWNTTRR